MCIHLDYDNDHCEHGVKLVYGERQCPECPSPISIVERTRNMDRREAFSILKDIVDSFPATEIIDALEADAGPGYRHYASERFSDAFVRSAREALEVLRKDLGL